ncbi:hypothetical protein AMTR_s00088p00152540 [Amborella trichopoda]|uniref:Disease resistance protein winged helix domain-containing protein n=1 Tax=Amborella trichopoda TaxID=13333 RepID=W1NY35_AMBTC|nr:hypothetical protein AMTR_s00088p00152540 [Amborella trichopoda]
MAEVTSPWSKVYKLEELTPEEAWLLFCKKAFGGTNGNSCPLELENIGRLVVKECEGLPLAIVAIGSVIYKRPKTIHAWDKVRRSLAYELDMDKGVKRILTLSYRDLSPLLKYCFLYCCFFPGDYEIPCRKVIRLWVSEGFIEGRRGITKMEVAADYFKELLDRSLIQVARLGLSGSIHTICVRDVMRNLGISLLEKEMFGAICDGKYNTFPDRIRSKYLRVLDLQGVQFECLPNGVGDLVHLRYLGLRDTGVKKVPKSLGELDKLANDPFVLLQKLHNLVFLSLSQASYVGTRIDKCDAGGFPKLQALVLKYLEEWEEWGEVEEVAMPYFQRVYIGNCRKLPQGFQYLTSLEHLVLRDIDDAFLRRLNRDSGEDHPKVQHIPNVALYGEREGKAFFEDL